MTIHGEKTAETAAPEDFSTLAGRLSLENNFSGVNVQAA